MADTVTDSRVCTWKLTMTKGNDVANRTISFDVENENLEMQIKPAMRDHIIPSLVGGGLSTAIQPTGWRDHDITEEEWHCTGVEVHIITKSDVLLDI